MCSVQHHPSTGASPGQFISCPIRIGLNDYARVCFLETIGDRYPGATLEVAYHSLDEHVVTPQRVADLSSGSARCEAQIWSIECNIIDSGSSPAKQSRVLRGHWLSPIFGQQEGRRLHKWRADYAALVHVPLVNESFDMLAISLEFDPILGHPNGPARKPQFSVVSTSPTSNLNLELVFIAQLVSEPLHLVLFASHQEVVYMGDYAEVTTSMNVHTRGGPTLLKAQGGDANFDHPLPSDRGISSTIQGLYESAHVLSSFGLLLWEFDVDGPCHSVVKEGPLGAKDHELSAKEKPRAPASGGRVGEEVASGRQRWSACVQILSLFTPRELLGDKSAPDLIALVDICRSCPDHLSLAVTSGF